MLAGFVLKRCCAHQFAYTHVHIEQKIHLRNFGNVALHKDCRLLGVESGSKVFCQDALYIGVKHIRVGCGQRMQIGYKVIGIVHTLFLHLHKVSQCSEIVAQMELSGGSDATQYYIFHYLICFLCFSSAATWRLNNYFDYQLIICKFNHFPQHYQPGCDDKSGRMAFFIAGLPTSTDTFRSLRKYSYSAPASLAMSNAAHTSHSCRLSSQNASSTPAAT